MNIANKIIAAFGDITHIHSKSLHRIYIIDARHCHLIPAIISISGILCLRNEKRDCQCYVVLLEGLDHKILEILSGRG